MRLAFLSYFFFFSFLSCTQKQAGRQMNGTQGQSPATLTGSAGSGLSIPTVQPRTIDDAAGNQTLYVLIDQPTNLGLNTPHYTLVTACSADSFYCTTGVPVGADAHPSLPGGQLIGALPGLSPGTHDISVMACKDLETSTGLEASCSSANTFRYTQSSYVSTAPSLRRGEKEMFPRFKDTAHRLALALQNYETSSKSCQDERFDVIKQLPSVFVSTFLGYNPFERGKLLSTYSLELLVTTDSEGKKHLTLEMNDNIYDLTFVYELSKLVASEDVSSEESDRDDKEVEDETTEGIVELSATAVAIGVTGKGIHDGLKDIQQSTEAKKTKTEVQQAFLDKTEAIFDDVKLKGKKVDVDAGDFSKKEVLEIIEMHSKVDREKFLAYMEFTHSMKKADSEKLWSNYDTLKGQVVSSGKFSNIKSRQDLDKIMTGNTGIDKTDFGNKALSSLLSILPLGKGKGGLSEAQLSKVVGTTKIIGSLATMAVSLGGGAAGFKESADIIYGSDDDEHALVGASDCSNLLQSVEDILDLGEESTKLQSELKTLQSQMTF